MSRMSFSSSSLARLSPEPIVSKSPASYFSVSPPIATLNLVCLWQRVKAEFGLKAAQLDPQTSLRQTVTHLFDAVRFSNHARELEETAAGLEAGRDLELNKLEATSEELASVVARMK